MMQETIRERLREIEAEESVRVLFACESGSRAWGFPSQDSDYDVRFLYIHTTDWYLSIREGRDVIERPLQDDLDINGWDLRKALRLLQKSNPPLLEWLGSPIVYSEMGLTAAKLRDVIARCYSPDACRYHYLSMAKGNFRDYLQGSTVSPKTYFYVLRPLLAIQWLEQNRGVPPTDFNVMVGALVDDGDLRRAIETLIQEKRAGAELDSGPRIESIARFVEFELARHEADPIVFTKNTATTEALDAIFLDALREVWQT